MDTIDLQDQLIEIKNKLAALESAITNRDRTLDDIADGASIILCEVIDSIKKLTE